MNTIKDPLLNSLDYISRYYGQANSPDALVAGLPLKDGLLTVHLFPRAAATAGLNAKLEELPLNDLPPLLLPVVALLKMVTHALSCLSITRRTKLK